MNETVRTEFLLHVQYSKYANKINLQIEKKSIKNAISLSQRNIVNVIFIMN